MEGLRKFINDEKTIDQIVSFPEGCRNRLVGELIRAYLVFKDEKYSMVYLERLHVIVWRKQVGLITMTTL